jgi:cysteinyl-tRNA synthetase
MLKIYNSLSRKKEIFTPRVPGKVGIYVCGVTVYDYCHLGHARFMVAFDVITRFLRSLNYDVTYVSNITDIDDKIIQRAQERSLSIQELTEYFVQAMHQDQEALSVLPSDIEPRATNYIHSIIVLIQRLLDLDVAYVSGNGDVCFQVEKFSSYGKLAHKDLDGLIAGARIEVVAEKKSPLDFVLWKKAKELEPSWPSPWGAGRPGWHIECSAMAMQELGEQFDIHGGGLDLQFPHHENEIAQSEGATGKPFANYWMHVGMLQVNEEKMSKSLNNFFTISDILKLHHPEIVRYFLLSSHYRSPLNYSEENLQNAQKGLIRLYQALKSAALSSSVDEGWVEKFNKAMSDDFNTPIAISVLFDLSHEINRTKSSVLANTLKHLGAILGILQREPENFLQSGIDDTEMQIINDLIKARLQARYEKNWTKADQIRAKLLDMKVELEDSAQGTTWRRITS